MNLRLLRRPNGLTHVEESELTPYCMAGYFQADHAAEQNSTDVDAGGLCTVCLRRLRYYCPDVRFKQDRNRTEMAAEPETPEVIGATWKYEGV